ncbi:4907_t:CDS:1 [Racocetra persica]|uniref:4907_t:CDS:1 n=1 Tax=Racocetra persica TaxID=160502 RepID=A0ACA9P8U9_9GLOM|nr:4907_t:CDS:1 [Racocetra persica]
MEAQTTNNLLNLLPLEGIQALKQFLKIWKNNNTINNIIEISGQNIFIIHEDGSKITSPIEDIIQQSMESIVEYNNLYEEFINSEEWDTMLQNFEPPEIPNIQENVEITEVPLEENSNHQSSNKKNNKFLIEQIKRDLAHEIENRVQMNSPYQDTD